MRACGEKAGLSMVPLILRVGWLPFVVILLGSTGGCQSSSKPDSKEESWVPDPIAKTAHAGEGVKDSATYRAEVDVQALDGSLWVLVNGFPTYVFKKGRFTEDHVDPPINTALIGVGNQYTLRIEPWVEQSGGDLRIGSAEVEGRVSVNEKQIIPGSEIESTLVDSAYAAWSERAREQWATYRSTVEAGALDSMRAWASRNPMTVSTTFDNEAGPDFSKIFEEAPRLEDSPATRKRLKDYAMHLRDLMARKDTSALFEEFRFYYAQQYKITGYKGGVQEDKASLRENVVMDDPELNFGREEIGLRRWSEGRVWEVYREGADAFFQSGNTIREVYVAEIDGALKVVR